MNKVIEQTAPNTGQALLQARQRKADRERSIASELLELASDGVTCPYSAPELLELEQNGFVYDFVAQEVIEVT